MLERDVEKYLVQRVKALGGLIRKVKWVGRSKAPDRLVLLPPPKRAVWVELKNPETIKKFPANEHERAQNREHHRLRLMGQEVKVIGSTDYIDDWLGYD
jgi:hypothetical protein